MTFPTWGKKLAFGLLTVLLVAGAIEGASWIALRRLAPPAATADVSRFLGEQSEPTSDPHRSDGHLEAADVERLVDPAYKRVNGQAPWVTEVLHPYVGFVMTPDNSSSHAFSDLGWMHEVLYHRADDKLIVALMGGSVARQLTELGGTALAQELEKAPRFRGKKVVLVGLNLGGYKQPQQLMTLNYLLTLGGEFDIVINVDGFNEVALHEAENGPKGVFPIFPRWWNGRVNDVGNTTIRLYAGELAYLRHRLRELSSSENPLYKLQVGKVWRAFQIRRLYRDIERVAGDIMSSSSGRAVRYVATGPAWQFSEGELYQHLVDVWSRSSIQMHHLCTGNGIKYYHFLQPNQYVEGSKPMGAEEREIAIDPDHRYRPGAVKGYPLLIRAGAELRARGVPFVDLTRVFADRQAQAYSDSCCHLTEDAAVEVAKRIARTIVDDKSENGDAPRATGP